MYSLLSDIFLNNHNIFFKPHPGDMSNYDLIFNKEIIIDREMPSELIKFIINRNFDNGICTYTTSIDSLKNYINNIYEFDDTIVEFKDTIFKLLFLYELAKELKYSLNIKETSLSNNFEKMYKLNGRNSINYEVNLHKKEKDILARSEYFEKANIIVEISETFPQYCNTENKIEKLYMNVKDKKLRNYILNFRRNINFSLSKCLVKITVYEVKKGK